MKKLILSLIAIVALVPMIVQANELTVLVNGYELTSNVSAQIINDRTMLPMRPIFERIGARVTWMESEKIIFATKGDFLITMQIDNNIMSVQKTDSDEVKTIELDSPPIIRDNSTIVPVRAVAESLGAFVGWDPETQTVTIDTDAYEED